MFPTSSSTKLTISHLKQRESETSPPSSEVEPQNSAPARCSPFVVVRRSFDCIAVHMSLVLAATGGKTYLLSIYFAVGDLRAVIAGFKRSGNHLKSLFQCEFSLWNLPRPFHLGRHDPKMRGAPIVAAFLHMRGFIVSPFSHIECIRYDPRSGLKIKNLGTKLEIYIRQQKHRDNSGLRKVALEQ